MTHKYLYWPDDATHYDPKTFRFLKKSGGMVYERPLHGKRWQLAEVDEFPKIPKGAIKHPQDMHPCLARSMNEETPFRWPKEARKGVKYGVFRRRLMRVCEHRNFYKYRLRQIEEAKEKAKRIVAAAETAAAEELKILQEKEERFFG